MRILLIEDSEPDSFLIQRALRDFQCDVQTVKSLKEAKETKEQFQPDIIILDVELPDSNRHTLRSAIAMMSGYAAVIVLSGHGADETSIPECQAAGADDYIEKTLLSEDPRKFLLRISRAWSSYKSRTIVLPRSASVERDLNAAQTKLISKSQRLPNVERDASLAVEQNLQIMIQLGSIEEKVDHTNGTVKEHTALLSEHAVALADVVLRHQREDDEKAEMAKAIEEEARIQKRYREKVMTNLRWILGLMGAGVITFIFDGLAHWLGWK